MATTQTRTELLAHLTEQLDFIRADCEQFDAGRREFAKRIAVAIRVTLHNGNGGSRSLLGQIRDFERTGFLDTAGHFLEGNLAATSNLIFQRGVVQADGTLEPSYMPVLDDYAHRTRLIRPSAFGHFVEPAAGRFLPFAEWWTMPVICDSERTVFSRCDLVLALANKDGGAHVDPQVRDAYYRLSRSNSLGYAVTGGGVEREYGNPVLPSMRQIGHEVLRSLARPGGRYR